MFSSSNLDSYDALADKKMDRTFHINKPYYGAWTKYGWGRDDWGLGLSKPRIDKLGNATVLVSYGKSNQQYTIKAEKVKTFPIEEIKNSGLKVYIVPKSALNYKTIKIIGNRDISEIKETNVI